MKKIKTLGLFDSGLGGYSVFNYLKKTLPNLSLVLYADQKNAPYGNQSREAIINHSKKVMEWFKDQGIMDVLIACNTATAAALDVLITDYPTMNIMGIIELTVNQIPENSEENVAVISTQVTHDSQAYLNAFHKNHNTHAQSKALPQLVNYIEGLENPRDYLQQELESLQDCETLVLGCTHYPLVQQDIAAIFKGRILDSRDAIADFLRPMVEASNPVTYNIYTSADPDKMAQQIHKLFSEDEKVRGL